MATLGLSNAISNFQRGADWKSNREYNDELRGRQRKQWDEEDKRRRAREEADAAGAAVLAGFQQQQGTGLADTGLGPAAPMDAGAHPTEPAAPQAGPGLADAPGATLGGMAGGAAAPSGYQPQAQHLIKAYEARGAALAKAGDFKAFTENFAKMAPLRAEVRNKAINDAMVGYKLHGDVGKLAKEAYATVNDGRQIEKVDKTANGIVLHFSDGAQSQPMPAEAVLDIVQRIQADPAKVAEAEFKHALKLAEQAHETKGRISVERVKGEETRKTLDQRGEQTLAQIDAKGDVQLTLADVNNKSRERIADKRVSGTITAAEIRAKNGGGSGGGSGAKVQSRITDEHGNVILVMRDGTHKALVGDDGRPVRSLDFQKHVGQVTRDIGKTDFGGSYNENRGKAEKTLGAAKPPAGGSSKDYSNLWK